MATELAFAGGGFLSVSEKVFDCAYNTALVHHAVVTYHTRGRAGTKAQKSRAEVRGAGSKPWRQKGTGRARAGSRKGPIWRGGGRTFAAKPKNYSPKLNVKMFRGAVRSVLSGLRREGRLWVGRDLSLAAGKTRELKKLLDSYDMTSVLIVFEKENANEDNFRRASRNLHLVDVAGIFALHPARLMARRNLLLSEPAVADIESWLS